MKISTIVRRNDYNSNIKKFYLFSVMIILLLFSEKDMISIYHFNISKIIMFIVLFAISLLATLIHRRNLYIDFISYLLFFRLVIYLIPLLYIQNIEHYWGNYFTIICTFTAYFICSQNHKDDITKNVNRINLIAIVIICLQVIYTFINLKFQPETLNINQIKFNLIIPAGASNYIACIILPLFLFLLHSKLKFGTKVGIVIISVLSLLMIQSKNAIFVLIVILDYKAFAKYFNKFIKIKFKSNLTIIVITLTFILLITSISFFIIRYFLYKWYMGMSFDSSSTYDLINAFTSNRLNVYSNEISRWTQHIFLGNGLSYSLGISRSHNWIIELLVQSGVVGFISYIVVLIIWFIKTAKYKNDKFIKACFYFILTIFIQGLAEVSLFTYSIDIMLWSFIGLSVSHTNYLTALKSQEVS